MFFSLSRAISAIAALSVSTGLASAPLPAGWQWYHNARYGYSICYPSNVFRRGREADAGDGARFSAGSGVSLSVYAGLDDDGAGLATYVAQDKADLAGGVVSYTLLRPTVAAVSGVDGQQIVYRKHLKRGDVVSSLMLAYPASRAAYFKPIVERMSRCFIAGDPFAHV